MQHTCKNRACPICGPELSLKCRRAVLWLPLADSIEFGNMIIQESVNVGFMEPGSLGIWDQEIKEMKTLKIKIRITPNVGKVWVSFEAIFLKSKNAQTKSFFAYFPWLAKGPYSPGLGSYVGVI